MEVIKLYKKRSVLCFASVLLIFCFHRFVSQKISFIRFSTDSIVITDYTYYIIMVKAFWFQGLGNIYELSFQNHALSMHVGSQIHVAMPLGSTPIGLVLWLPFAYVARCSMPLSYTLWSSFSIGVLLVSLWNVSRYAFQLKKLDLLPITLVLVTLFSLNTLFSIYLGQTSVLAAGVLINLFYIVHKTVNESQSGNWLLILLLIFILGIKPTYIALGLGLLIIYGMWKEMLYSAILIIVVLIGITPLLTVEWVPSYLNHLRMFSQGNIPDVYAGAVTLETTNIFRSAFRLIFSDSFVSLISNVIYYSVYISVIGLFSFVKIRGKSIDQLGPLKITKEQFFVLLVTSYLLFVPFAGAYEDVLLLTVFVTVLIVGNTPPLNSYKSFVLVFFLFIILLHNIFPLNKPLWLFWILKAVILGYMLNFSRSPSEKKSRENSLI